MNAFVSGNVAVGQGERDAGPIQVTKTFHHIAVWYRNPD